MFFGNLPLQFIADMSVQGEDIRFQPTELLLRYVQGANEPCVPAPPATLPAISAIVADGGTAPESRIPVDPQWWTLERQISYGREHVLALKFNGVEFWNQFDRANPQDMALLRTFLDQETLVLEFDMAPGVTVVDQQTTVPKWVAALHVRLLPRTPPA